MREKRIRLNTMWLKILACICMLIDHIGAIFIMPLIQNGGKFYIIFLIMRNIGRIAFPIFAFLIVEGFVHTKNYKKYLTRIFIFSIISTIPYNLCFGGMVYNIKYWRNFTFGNVGWTFTLALIMLYSLKILEDKKYNTILKWIISMLIIAIFMMIANLIKCDRKYWGILVIAGFYLFRHSRPKQLMTGIITFLDQRYMPGVYLSLIPLALYNGEKGKDISKFVYVFIHYIY